MLSFFVILQDDNFTLFAISWWWAGHSLSATFVTSQWWAGQPHPLCHPWFPFGWQPITSRHPWASSVTLVSQQTPVETSRHTKLTSQPIWSCSVLLYHLTPSRPLNPPSLHLTNSVSPFSFTTQPWSVLLTACQVESTHVWRAQRVLYNVSTMHRQKVDNVCCQWQDSLYCQTYPHYLSGDSSLHYCCQGLQRRRLRCYHCPCMNRCPKTRWYILMEVFSYHLHPWLIIIISRGRSV